jgi:NADH dehydrogenase
MTRKETVLLTGGTGFIGRNLHVELDGPDRSVRDLGRAEPGPYRWQLGEAPDPGAFQDADVLVHAAFDMRLTEWKDIQKINIDGTKALFDAAASAGVTRFILISSIAAFENCESDYGRAKLTCEEIAEPHGACIMRPGLVYGEQSGGVYAAMENWVKSLPVTPILTPSPNLYMCHVADLCALIREIVDRPSWNPRTVTVACPTPLGFKDVVGILQARHGVRKPLLPVPWRLPWLACKTLEVVGLQPPFRSDGLVGLMRGNPQPDFSALREFGTSFRSLDR